MRNKLVTIVLLICTVLLLSRCGTDSKNSNRIVKNFEKDSYTQKVESVNLGVKEEETPESNDEGHNGGYDDTLSEITLIGKDNSKTYTIVADTDIEYRGTVYRNLYKNIQYINTNYDKNTLINFIIKTYKPNSSLIYTVLTNSETDVTDGDIEVVTFDDMLSDIAKYKEVKHKYDEEISWMLQLIDSKTRHEVQIFGAKSFILLTTNGVSSDIDMTKYDSSVSEEVTNNE